MNPSFWSLICHTAAVTKGVTRALVENGLRLQRSSHKSRWCSWWRSGFGNYPPPPQFFQMHSRSSRLELWENAKPPVNHSGNITFRNAGWARTTVLGTIFRRPLRTVLFRAEFGWILLGIFGMPDWSFWTGTFIIILKTVLFKIMFYKTPTRARAFSVVAPSQWNQLPGEVHVQQDTNSSSLFLVSVPPTPC